MDILKDLGLDVSKEVESLRIDTTLLPPITINKPFEQTQAPNALLSILKPQITVKMSNDLVKPMVAAPYGKPIINYWPYIRNALLLLAAGYVIKKVLK